MIQQENGYGGIPNTRIVSMDKIMNQSGVATIHSLSEARLTNPDTINMAITHLMGRESSRFPLQFMTEGQYKGSSATSGVGINGIEFKWRVMGEIKRYSEVANHNYPADSKLGFGGLPFKITFKDKLFSRQQNVLSKNGYQARVEGEPVSSNNGFEYTFTAHRTSDKDFIPVEEFAPNSKWGNHGGANVSESHSFGNSSTSQAPGEIKNQLGIFRRSYHLAGNISNQAMCFKLPNATGGMTEYFLEYDEWLQEMKLKEEIEEALWESRYNRDINGRCLLTDSDTGEEIPTGAGLREQIPNIETYGELDERRLHSIFNNLFYRATDQQNVQVVLYAGQAFIEVFNRIMVKSMSGWNVFDGALNRTITGSDPMNLNYGFNFSGYRHQAGHTITVKHAPFLDNGTRAQIADIHPETGYPMTSYEAYFIDHSTYDGVRNVQFVHQKGRALLRGIEQGMTVFDKAYGVKGVGNYGNTTVSHSDLFASKSNTINLATSQDKTSIHYLRTGGITMNRPNTSLFFKAELN